MKNQITMLKVKIKSLAAETRMIRLEERKAKGKRMAKSKWKAGEERVRDPKYLVIRFRDDAKYKSLRDHRLEVVSVEARLSLLAYGYLRGVPYAAMEKRPKDKYGHACRSGKAWVEPDWKKVLSMVVRFGSLPGAKDKTADEWNAAMCELTAWHQVVAVKQTPVA